MRNNASLGPYSKLMPRALWWSLGGGGVLMSEVPLQLEDFAKVEPRTDCQLQDTNCPFQDSTRHIRALNRLKRCMGVDLRKF